MKKIREIQIKINVCKIDKYYFNSSNKDSNVYFDFEQLQNYQYLNKIYYKFLR